MGKIGKPRYMLTSLLLAAAVSAGAGEQPSPQDSRYPVTLTPQEALTQKAEMRTTLVALRRILAALPEKDFAAVEKAAGDLGHKLSPSAQKVVSTTVYLKLEAGFRGRIDEVTAAARAKDSDAVLRKLSEMMAYCQTCHAALRQEIVPAESDPSPPEK